MNMIAAVVLVSLSVLSVLPIPALAQNAPRAELRLTVVDETRAPLANATVTVFTMYGDRIVTTDKNGVIVVADLPTASTEWWVHMPGYVSSADATRLKPGENRQTVTLHTAKPSKTDTSQSGS